MKNLCGPISELRRRLGGLRSDRDTVAVLLFVLSVWLPFYVGGVLLLGLWVYVLISRERRKAIFRLQPFGVFIWLLPALSLLSSLIGKNLMGVGISVALFVMLTSGFYMRTVMTRERFEKGLFLLLMGSLFAAVVALVQNFLVYGYNPDYRPTATAQSANYYGLLIVFTVMAALVGLKERGHRLFYALTILVNLFALYICESRSSQLALAACVLLYLLLEKRRLLAGSFTLLGAAALFVGWRYPDVFSWTNSLQYILTERVQIWHGVLIGFTESLSSILIGRGPMTYIQIAGRLGTYFANHAHNILFDCLINYGLIGTAAFFVFGFELVRTSTLWERTGVSRYIGVISLLALAATMVSGIFDVTILWSQTAACLLFLHAGTGIGTSAVPEVKGENS